MHSSVVMQRKKIDSSEFFLEMIGLYESDDKLPVRKYEVTTDK